VAQFVVIGRTARASGDFIVEDLPGSSGRLDVLVRCLRAGLLVSHGVRPDAVVYLVLGGGPRAPRVARVDGATAKFLRPDERSLAVLLGKALAAPAGAGAPGGEGSGDSPASAFVGVRPGVAITNGGLEAALAELTGAGLYVLDEEGDDVRAVAGIADPRAAFVVGDHLGFDDETRRRLSRAGARAISVGPTSLHAEDAIAILWNEIDRLTSATGGP
jgi:tRNA (pseudouridine54-N1)-methyltransferase